MPAAHAIEVLILGRAYRVACPPEQEKSLLAAARLVDEKMRAVRDAGKVADAERMAVIAGINLAYEALSGSLPGATSGAPDDTTAAALTRCHALVDAMLDDRCVGPAADAEPERLP